MRSYYVEVTCQASVKGDELEDEVDSLMEALDAEPGVTDPDIGMNLENGHLDFCLYVEAADSSAALRQAHVLVRSALHKAGNRTPQWDEVIRAISDDDASTRVRPADLVCL